MIAMIEELQDVGDMTIEYDKITNSWELTVAECGLRKVFTGKTFCEVINKAYADLI